MPAPQRLTHVAALVALHVAVALFGFAGLFGKWLALSPVAIVLGRTAIAAVALGILYLRTREHAPFDVRLIGNGIVLARPLAQLLRRDPGVDRRRRPARLRQLSAVHAAGRARVLRAPMRRREGLTALLVTAGLALLVPEFSLANPVVQGLGWGLVSGFTFALLVVMNRRWTGTRAAPPTSLSGRTLLRGARAAALRLGGSLGHRDDRRARDHAAASCWASPARRSRTRCSSAGSPS